MDESPPSQTRTPSFPDNDSELVAQSAETRGQIEHVSALEVPATMVN